jgi:hypothetical protein
MGSSGVRLAIESSATGESLFLLRASFASRSEGDLGLPSDFYIS